MIGDTASLKVYLAPGITDMRKSINGLALIVNEVLALDPFFRKPVLCSANRGRNKLKKSCTGKPMAFGCTTGVLRRGALNGRQQTHRSKPSISPEGS